MQEKSRYHFNSASDQLADGGLAC